VPAASAAAAGLKPLNLRRRAACSTIVPLPLVQRPLQVLMGAVEQRALKNVNNCLNTNIYSYLDASGGQSSNQYLNVVHFFNTSVN
jgi:hypothetical protein